MSTKVVPEKKNKLIEIPGEENENDVIERLSSLTMDDAVVAKFYKGQSEYHDTSDSCTSENDSHHFCTDQSTISGGRSYTDDEQSTIEKPSSNQSDQLTNIIDIESSKEESNRKSLGLLLSLPYDVRLIIYRNILQSNKMIESVKGSLVVEYMPNGTTHDLHPQIMATCRQIHSECRSILYGENAFQVSIYEIRDTVSRLRSPSDNNPYFIPRMVEELQPLKFRDMKRIELEVSNEDIFKSGFQEAMKAAGRLLSALPKLQHLSLNFDLSTYAYLEYENVHTTYPAILAIFGMIRHVGTAHVEGIPRYHAEYLMEKMTASSTIPKMYFDLEFWVWPTEYVARALEKARAAAEKDNLDAFLREKEKVVDIVTSRRAGRHARPESYR